MFYENLEHQKLTIFPYKGNCIEISNLESYQLAQNNLTIKLTYHIKEIKCLLTSGKHIVCIYMHYSIISLYCGQTLFYCKFTANISQKFNIWTLEMDITQKNSPDPLNSLKLSFTLSICITCTCVHV